MRTHQFFFLFSFLLVIEIGKIHAQNDNYLGLTGGIARFYPNSAFFSQSLNNKAENGFDWSLGVYYEKQFRPKIKPIIELNFNNSTGDFYIETSSYSSETGESQQPKSDMFQNTSFKYLSVSVGSKFFFNKKIFVYPGFELAKSLDRRVDLWSISYYSKEWDFVYLKDRYLSKTSYYAMLGVGIDLNAVDLILEYKYGLNYQLSFFEYSSPFGVNHRNKYLQLKVQVPLYRFR